MSATASGWAHRSSTNGRSSTGRSSTSGTSTRRGQVPIVPSSAVTATVPVYAPGAVPGGTATVSHTGWLRPASTSTLATSRSGSATTPPFTVSGMYCG